MKKYLILAIIYGIFFGGCSKSMQCNDEQALKTIKKEFIEIYLGCNKNNSGKEYICNTNNIKFDVVETIDRDDSGALCEARVLNNKSAYFVEYMITSKYGISKARLSYVKPYNREF